MVEEQRFSAASPSPGRAGLQPLKGLHRIDSHPARRILPLRLGDQRVEMLGREHVSYYGKVIRPHHQRDRSAD